MKFNFDLRFLQTVFLSPLVGLVWPITKQQILDSSKMKQFADDNFKLDETGTKVSKWVENTVGKGEIARYEQFLLFPQCFQKTCTADTWKPGLVWERVSQYVTSLCINEGQTNKRMVPYPQYSSSNCRIQYWYFKVSNRIHLWSICMFFAAWS